MAIIRQPLYRKPIAPKKGGGGLGGILGAVGGGILGAIGGGPAGALAGASAGQALGGMAGETVSPSENGRSGGFEQQQQFSSVTQNMQRDKEVINQAIGAIKQLNDPGIQQQYLENLVKAYVTIDTKTGRV